MQITPRRQQSTHSIDRRLFHDAHELVQINRAIPILIELIDHGLQLLVTQLLTQLACHSSKIAYTDRARLIVIEESERLLDLIVGIALSQLSNRTPRDVSRRRGESERPLGGGGGS